MTRIAIILTLLIGLTVSIEAAETKDNPVKVYLGAGVTFPLSPTSFRTEHNAGINVYTALGYSVSPFTEFIGRLELYTTPLDTDNQFGNIEFTGGGLDILVVGVDVKFSNLKPPAKVRPFVSLGAGITRLSQSNINTDLAFEQYAWLLFENQTKPYYSLGAGLDIKPAPNLDMFLLVRYFSVSQDEANKVFLPITIGFRF